MNPWWATSTAAPSSETFRRRGFDRLASWMAEESGLGGALLIGFRRVGKTVLARQVLEHVGVKRSLPAQNLVYADFQRFALAGVGPRDVVDAVRTARGVKGSLACVFDEIQFVTHWDKQLRSVIHDHAPQGVRILATGSGSADLHRAAGDTLLDRAKLFTLSPMTFAESLEFNFKATDPPPDVLDKEFRRYLVRGGFPALQREEGDHASRERLLDICEQYVIHGDLGRRLKLRNTSAFGKLWLHLVHNPGATLDWAKLPGEFGVARETFDDWISAMLQAELVVELEPSQVSGLPLHGRKRYSRLYAVDHALHGAYGVPVEVGGGFEALVLHHLRGLRERLRTDHGSIAHLTYWRDERHGTSGEVDFRVEGDNVSLLVEAKGGHQVANSWVAGLSETAARLKNDRALLVYNGTERRSFTRRVGDRTVSVYAWPIVEFLLAADRCGPTARELFDAA